MILKLNENVDLELKPLKALRQQIKDFRQKQYDDIYNQYKKKDGKNEVKPEVSDKPMISPETQKVK